MLKKILSYFALSLLLALGEQLWKFRATIASERPGPAKWNSGKNDRREWKRRDGSRFESAQRGSAPGRRNRNWTPSVSK